MAENPSRRQKLIVCQCGHKLKIHYLEPGQVCSGRKGRNGAGECDCECFELADRPGPAVSDLEDSQELVPHSESLNNLESRKL